jgi:hypothetical protein
MTGLPDDVARVFRAKAFPMVAHPARLGFVHLSPVWAHVDERERIVINTTVTRAKGKYLQLGAAVSLCAFDPESPYRYVTVHGRVVERTTDDGLEVIDMLCRKYHDGRPWKAREGEQRVTIRIEAERAIVYG